MARTRLRKHRWLAALAVLTAPLISSAGARAQSDEDESKPPPAETPAPPPPKAETVAATPAASVPLFEEMGPDTYPGRLRGLYGGSLWLERSFDGLQWPRNSHTGIGVSGMFSVGSGYEVIKRDQSTLLNSTSNLQQGRGLLRLTPAYVHDRFFIQGQVELVASACQAPAPNAQTASVCSVSGTATTDDLLIRVGHWRRRR